MELSSQTEFQDNGELLLQEELEKVDFIKRITQFCNLYFYKGKKEYFVMLQQGRVATKLATKIKKFKNKEKAVEFFFKKLLDKKRKCYQKSQKGFIPISFFDFSFKETLFKKSVRRKKTKNQLRVVTLKMQLFYLKMLLQ